MLNSLLFMGQQFLIAISADELTFSVIDQQKWQIPHIKKTGKIHSRLVIQFRKTPILIAQL